MSLLLFSNNASTTLAANITSTATSLSVASGQGALFPNPSSGQYFRATIVKNGTPGTFEIVKVTAANADTFTIQRAQEGTTALSWAVGDYFNLFVTAADLAAFAQFDDLQSQGGGYAADTGTTNAYVAALTPALTQHIVGMPIRWKAAQTNTGASTFSDGFAAANLVTPEGTALLAGDIVAGGVYISIWDGAQFQLVTVHHPSFSQLTGTASAAQIPALDASKIATGTLNTARLGSGTASSSTVLFGNSAWAQPSFVNLSGTIGNSQVPLSAVQQYQGSLAIAFTQLTGSIAAGQVPQAAVTQYQSALSIGGGQITSAVAEANRLYLTSGYYATFNWSGQSGQPSWLFGSNDGQNVYVWNPANFSVANAAELAGLSPSSSAYGSTVAVRDTSGGLSAVYFNSSSDERLKDEVTPIEGDLALDIVCELLGVTFRWKRDGKRSAGYIAQRLLGTRLAHLVSQDADGFLQVNYAGVMPYVSAALGRLRAEHQEDRRRLIAAEARIAAVETLLGIEGVR